MKKNKNERVKNIKQKEIRIDKCPDEFYFDDCPICRAMRAVDERGVLLSTQELKRVFKEANTKKGIKK